MCVVYFMQIQCFIEIIWRIFEKNEVSFRIIVTILFTPAEIRDLRLQFALSV